MCEEFARYAQMMIKAIFKNKFDLGKNPVGEVTPSHDCITWFSPGGHLDGPRKDSARCLRVVQAKAADKVVKAIDRSITNRRANKEKITKGLRKGLRTSCNRRSKNARILVYRYVGVYMDTTVPKATEQPAVITAAPGAILGPECSVPKAHEAPAFQIVLADGDPITKTQIDPKAVAAGLLGEVLAIDHGDVTASARLDCASCIVKDARGEKILKLLRPESEHVRKSAVKTLRQELRDQALGSVNLPEQRRSRDRLPYEVYSRPHDRHSRTIP